MGPCAREGVEEPEPSFLAPTLVGWMGLKNLGTVTGLMGSMYDDQLVPIQDLGGAEARWEGFRRR